jgi:thiamine kinase-like enzyme
MVSAIRSGPVNAPEVSGATLSGRLLDGLQAVVGRPQVVCELSGGLTNRNFKVTTADGTYVVRIYADDADGLRIDREREYANTLIAASTGVGAPVVAHLPAEHAMVMRFIDGVTLTDATIASGDNLRRVADACRRLHRGPSFVNDFDMFEVQQDYLRRVLDRGYRLPPGYLDHAPDVERIRSALAVRPEGTVACHNDLLAGNLIDDGAAIRLIDYEYAGNNDPCFELGNIWSECHLDAEQLEELVVRYYGRPRRSRVARAHLLGLMSQYGWTLWASIQDACSRIDFDYWTWGMERYDRAEGTFGGPQLARWIDESRLAD